MTTDNQRFSEEDIGHMRQALELGKTGEGRVSPNPPVGCVLVRHGAVVGRGWHNRLGSLHAEAMALQDAGTEAAGATAYVTLSPCTSHGRQPPCADALIRAGVAEVVIASEDPNPTNATGADVLREAGIPTRTGLLREEAEYLARGFFKMMRRGLPYLTLKYAMTMDGKIAASSGDSRWISGPESREFVQDMRSRHDAVLVGSGTARIDNPLLTLRDPVWRRRGGQAAQPQPARVIVDSQCRLSPAAALFDSSQGPGGPVIVAATSDAPADRVEALRQAGAEVVLFPSENNRVPLSRLMEHLGQKGISMVLCEGGAGLAAGLLEERLADEIVAFIAPKIVGGRDAPGPVGGQGSNRMADALQLEMREAFRVGADWCLRASVPAKGQNE